MQSNVESIRSGYGSETEVATSTSNRSSSPRILTLRLRSHQQQTQLIGNQTEVQTETKKPSVRWTEETVNNENMGRKSSKRCCIYHKPKKFYESDSDESDEEEKTDKESSSSSESNQNKTKKKPIKPFQRHHA